jgi:hypothetical protein
MTGLATQPNGQDKYVELDLSACTMGDSTEFNPRSGSGTGKQKVVSLTLPDTAETINTIPAGNTPVDQMSAFKDFINLTEVSGAGITEIPGYAFYDLGSLTTVSFPAATEISGTLAFYGCTSLTTANFPAAEDISYRTFDGCTSLTTANFPAVTDIAELAFANTGSTVVLTITMGSTAPTNLDGGIFSSNTENGNTTGKTVTVLVPYANSTAWAAAGYTTGTADDTWTTRFTNGSSINLTIQAITGN